MEKTQDLNDQKFPSTFNKAYNTYYLFHVSTDWIRHSSKKDMKDSLDDVGRLGCGGLTTGDVSQKLLESR